MMNRENGSYYVVLLERFERPRLPTRRKTNLEFECRVCVRSRGSFESHHNVTVTAFRGVSTRDSLFPGRDTTDGR